MLGQRDHVRARGHCAPACRSPSSLERACDRRARGAACQRHGRELERAAAAQAFRILGEARIDPIGLTLARSDQHEPQHGVGSAEPRGDLGAASSSCRDVPELLEVVELADARQHHVHDDVAQIDEHPLARLLAFHAERRDARVVATLEHGVGERTRTCRSERPLATTIVSVTLVR